MKKDFLYSDDTIILGSNAEVIKMLNYNAEIHLKDGNTEAYNENINTINEIKKEWGGVELISVSFNDIDYEININSKGDTSLFLYDLIERGSIELIEPFMKPQQTNKSWDDMTLSEIIEEYKDGDAEPLDGDAVDNLTEIIRIKLNLTEGNLTENEYNAMLDNRNIK